MSARLLDLRCGVVRRGDAGTRGGGETARRREGGTAKAWVDAVGGGRWLGPSEVGDWFRLSRANFKTHQAVRLSGRVFPTHAPRFGVPASAGLAVGVRQPGKRLKPEHHTGWHRGSCFEPLNRVAPPLPSLSPAQGGGEGGRGPGEGKS